ncbi:MAG: SDR family NAD(P)-dependent oxidoreductase [Polyangiales bacterium]
MATKNEAWVVGVGARAGLGAAIARRFAREGFAVVVSGRTPDKLAAVVNEIQDQGGVARALPLDVSREADVRAAAEQLGDLEVAVFNAGGGTRAPTLDLSAQAFEDSWRVGTLGGFLFGREALRKLAARKQGTLLFTGATASLRGKPPFAGFAASKAGLRSLAQTFAREFGPQGVHVAHVIIDGGIDGERLRTHSPDRDPDGLLGLDAIADVYWHLHAQPRSAWTQELDLRPYKESF